MSTMTLSDESIEWGERGISLTRILQYFRSIFGTEKTTSDDMAAFERAMNTLKLAAEPGENYGVIAARIKREATTYRDFLLNPKPIGKISLIVKELDPDSPDFTRPREQLQIHDPAKGWASVGYEFDRSDTKVLEFIMYDKDSSPLFAITRTYSNWIGSREFKLGLNRVFCLNMVEASPGKVMAYASFKLAAAREGARYPERTRKPLHQVAPPVVNTEPNLGVVESRPFGRRLAYLLVLQCVAISLICSTVIWIATSRAMSRQGLLARQTTDRSLTDTSRDTSAGLSDGKTTLYAISGGTGTSSDYIGGEVETTRKSRMAHKAKRLAKVERFSISVDNNSCKSGESRCLELLSTIQKKVEWNLSSVSLRAYTANQPKEGIEPAKLVVSYNPVDTLHGHVHLTLYDQQGELWDDKGNLTYGAITESSIVENYCEEASSKILWEIITAKIRMNSNPQEGEKTSASE